MEELKTPEVDADPMKIKTYGPNASTGTFVASQFLEKADRRSWRSYFKKMRALRNCNVQSIFHLAMIRVQGHLGSTPRQPSTQSGFSVFVSGAIAPRVWHALGVTESFFFEANRLGKSHDQIKERAAGCAA